MPKINRLPKEVADLIAAGEVVERPASVVKELLENSIDAGATKVTIEIRGGGVRLIRVTDNGCGIAREDVRNAFVSHATSKVCTQADLDSIGTLGFRGEALASAAAVARVEMMTRPHGDETGTRYCIEGGQEILLDDAGCPEGTTILVRDLFYNTPARMKFLKKDVNEANAAAGVVDRIALSHPEVSFRLIREDKQTLLTPGDGSLSGAIYAVFGREFLADLLPVDYTCDGVGVKGYISKPIAARPNRTMQFFFLNGRFIRTGTGAAALSEAYKHAVPAGKFPACVLNITVPNHIVDVNVHPAKIEVRFENERPIFNAIYYGAKNVLEGDTSKPHPHLQAADKAAARDFFTRALEPKAEQVSFASVPKKNEGFFVHTSDPQVLRSASGSNAAQQDETIRFSSPPPAVPGREDFSFLAHPSAPKDTVPKQKPNLPPEPAVGMSVGEQPAPEPSPPAQEGIAEPDFRVIGEAFRTYILVESGDTILLIDKHAAHERMLYEQLKSGAEGKASQMLLSPVPVTLRKDAYDAVLAHADLLRDSGFAVEDFGTGTIAVTACPIVLDAADAAAAVEEIAGYLLQNRQDLTDNKTDWIYHNTACRAAIKGGDPTSEYELREFTRRLLSLPQIRTCPHGRPVMIELTRRELEKSFGRV